MRKESVFTIIIEETGKGRCSLPFLFCVNNQSSGYACISVRGCRDNLRNSQSVFWFIRRTGLFHRHVLPRGFGVGLFLTVRLYGRRKKSYNGDAASVRGKTAACKNAQKIRREPGRFCENDSAKTLKKSLIFTGKGHIIITVVT